MAQLPHTFPFPTRGWMLANMAVYFIFAVVIPVDFGAEMLQAGQWTGLALCASAVVSGGLAIFWLRYFDKLAKQLA